jgi:hypothetical protein
MEEVNDNFEVIKVTKDSSLRDYIEEIKKPNSYVYDSGCCYYELTDKEVNIDSDKVVIFMDKVSKL